MNKNLKIIMINISDIMPYKNNAKKHTEDQIDHIANSIQIFGMSDPIGVWGEKNIIVEGHGRFLAAKKLGIDEVPCIRLDHLTDDERRAYTIAHNSTSIETGFDDELLNIEIDDLDFNFDDFGIDTIHEHEVELKKQELSDYTKVHYLISSDISINDKILEVITLLEQIGGVEIESTLN